MNALYGRTRLWCPGCSSFQKCKAISPYTITSETERRFRSVEYSDVYWFQRARKCCGCGHILITGEIDEDLIFELIVRREICAAVTSQSGDALHASLRRLAILGNDATALRIGYRMKTWGDIEHSLVKIEWRIPSEP